MDHDSDSSGHTITDSAEEPPILICDRRQQPLPKLEFSPQSVFNVKKELLFALKRG